MGRRASVKRRQLQLEPLENRNLLTVLIGTREFPTIQDAIDNATAGNQILVGDGVYAESLDISRMGSAVGRGPGNLVIRGVDSASGAVLRALNGTALANSAAFSADLTLSQLTIESPAMDLSSHGIVLDDINGTVELHDLLFQNIDRNALQLIGLTGASSIRANRFLATGTDGTSTAVTLENIRGSSVLDDNNFADVAGTAIAVGQFNDTEATLAITGNIVTGDPNFLATTSRGVLVAASDGASLDLTLDHNQLNNLSGRTITVTASNESRLQTRWTSNDVSNVAGETALQMTVAGTADVTLTAMDNNVLDASGDGMQVTVQGGGQIATLLRNNLFLSIGDDATDRGLVIFSEPESDGTIAVLLDNNNFDTISGDGLVVSLDGASTGSFTIVNNFFTGTNSLGGTAAALLENVAGSSSAIQTSLHDNQVIGSFGDAYRLAQQDGVLALATTNNNTPQQQLASANIGTPIVVTGSITPIAGDALDDEQLLLLGDQAWIDENGDGIRQTMEATLPFATLHLTGTETESGVMVQRSTVTDATGRYLFGSLFTGIYTLSYEPALGLKVALANQGDDDTLDSDFSQSTGTVTVTLTADDVSLDLGVLRTWQNPRTRLDVNNDGLVTSNDVLRLINDINNNNRQTPLPLPTSVLGPPPYLDPNKDGFVTPNDVLQVINFLNAQISSGEGEGGDEGPSFRFGSDALLLAQRAQSDAAPARSTDTTIAVRALVVTKQTNARRNVRQEKETDELAGELVDPLLMNLDDLLESSS